MSLGRGLGRGLGRSLGWGWQGRDGSQLMPLPARSFAEVLGVECRGSSSLELSLKSEQLVLHAARASAIKAMIELFLSELKKASAGRAGGWQAAGLGARVRGRGRL